MLWQNQEMGQLASRCHFGNWHKHFFCDHKASSGPNSWRSSCSDVTVPKWPTVQSFVTAAPNDVHFRRLQTEGKSAWCSHSLRLLVGGDWTLVRFFGVLGAWPPKNGFSNSRSICWRLSPQRETRVNNAKVGTCVFYEQTDKKVSRSHGW